MVDGKKIINSKNANQSYDGLHKVFQQIFKKLEIAKKKPQNALLLGLGGGSVPSIIYEELQLNCNITAIELDPIMISLALNEFNMNRFIKLKIIESDAFDYVLNCELKFDLIIVDLFNDNAVPAVFCEEEFNLALINLLECGYILFNFINKNLAQAAQFERLKQLYKLQRNLLVGNYYLDANNDMLVIEKHFY